MLSSSKIHFRRAILGGGGDLLISRGTPNLVPWKTAKFGTNNCIINNFLHCEFHLSMFSSSSKILLWEENFGEGVPPHTPPGGLLNLDQAIVKNI